MSIKSIILAIVALSSIDTYAQSNSFYGIFQSGEYGTLHAGNQSHPISPKPYYDTVFNDSKKEERGTTQQYGIGVQLGQTLAIEANYNLFHSSDGNSPEESYDFVLKNIKYFSPSFRSYFKIGPCFTKTHNMKAAEPRFNFLEYPLTGLAGFGLEMEIAPHLWLGASCTAMLDNIEVLKDLFQNGEHLKYTPIARISLSYHMD